MESRYAELDWTAVRSGMKVFVKGTCCGEPFMFGPYTVIKPYRLFNKKLNTEFNHYKTVWVKG